MANMFDQDYYFHCVEVGKKTIRLFPKLSELAEDDKWDLLEFWQKNETASRADKELGEIRLSTYDPERERQRKKKRNARRGRPKGS